MLFQLQWFRQQRAELAFERTLSGRLVVLGRRATGLYCILRGLMVRIYAHLWIAKNILDANLSAL